VLGSEGSASARLAALLEGRPGLRGRLQVVPMSELEA
jgi:hypothetical protein